MNTEDGSGFQIQITCSGSEKNLSECTDYGKPPTGDCTIAAVSCKRYSSEGILLFQKVPYSCFFFCILDNSRCAAGISDPLSDDELERQLLRLTLIVLL